MVVMSGRSPPLYCTLTLIAMQGHQPQRFDIFSPKTAKTNSTSSNMAVIIYCYIGCELWSFGHGRKRRPGATAVAFLFSQQIRFEIGLDRKIRCHCGSLHCWRNFETEPLREMMSQIILPSVSYRRFTDAVYKQQCTGHYILRGLTPYMEHRTKYSMLLVQKSWRELSALG